MTANTITLTPVSQMGSSLRPGEIAIDEAGRALYIDAGSGPVAVPLDQGAIPARPRPTDPRAILVLGAEGPDWDVLRSSGGGPSVADVPGWFIPGAFAQRGLLTVNVTATNLATAVTAPFELTEDVTIRQLLVIPEAQNIDVHFGITDAAGVVLAQFTVNANAGAIDQLCEVTLTAGRYLTYLYVVSALNIQSLGYSHPWLPATALVEHMVFLRLN